MTAKKTNLGKKPTPAQIKKAGSFDFDKLMQKGGATVELDPNPKDGIGRTKTPLSLIPFIALQEQSLAYLEGKLKYGEVNWRAAPVYLSVYLDAMMRHMQKFSEGEDRDGETRVHHLGNVMACCGIILDAEHHGTLIDDRKMSTGGVNIWADVKVPELVQHLNTIFSDRTPKHYLIGEEKKKTEVFHTSKGRNRS